MTNVLKTVDQDFAAASLAAVALVIAMPSAAQTAQPDTASTSATGASAAVTTEAPDDILVTARRREERVQDIPLAITVLSSAAIDLEGINTVDDALLHTTNFDLRHDENPGITTISVRGVSQNRNGEAPVAFVVDGVTAVSPIEITQQLFDVERIEILKGPQGAIYGRNAIGGAISITTKTPTNDYEGEVKAAYGRHDDIRLSANISGPIVEDKILARLSGYYNNADGLLYNVTTMKRPDFSRDYGGRGRLLFNLSDAVKFDLRGNYSRLRAGADYYYSSSSDYNNNRVGVIQNDVEVVTYRKTWDISGKLDIETSLGTLTSTSMYLDLFQHIPRQDIDWLPISHLEAGSADGNKTFSEEVRLTSPSNQPFRYVFGGYYQHTKRYRLVDVYYNLNYSPTDPVVSAAANKDLVQVIHTPQDQTQITKSLFGQVNYDLLPELELTAAGRYDDDKRSDVEPLPLGTRRRHDSKFQPKLSIAYHVKPQSLLYATYAVGYRPGNFNAPNDIQASILSETLKTYEVGAKTSLFDNKLTLNGSVYYNNFRNEQFFLVTAETGGLVQLIVNGQKSTIWGFEAEASAAPTKDLALNASFGYTNGKIRKFDVPFPGGTTQYEGNFLPNTARYTLLLSAQYTPPITNDLNLLLRSDFRRYGRTYWIFDNIASQKPYNLVDLRAGVSGKKWSLTAYAENVFNKKYEVQRFVRKFSFFDTDISWPSRPVTYGLELIAKF